jgi:SAM-dependent methyltransferase
MKCRLCGSEARPLGDRGDVSLYRCGVCRFVSGRPLGMELAEPYYDNYYPDELPPPPYRRYEEWLAQAEALVGCGQLLEVGAGSGGLVRTALRRGWTVEATEVSRSGFDLLRAAGVSVFLGGVEEAHYADSRFDLVVSLEVLEHIGAPLEHLRELARVTRTGGLLLLTTPNFNGLSRRWMGLHWRVIHPEHLGYFTPSTLNRTLRQAGYRDVKVRSRSLDISTWLKRPANGELVQFDPQASARLRDAVQARPALQNVKEGMNALLALTGLGDSLLAWACK